MTRIAIIVGSTRPNALGPEVGTWVFDRAGGRSDAEYELISVADQNLPLLDEPLPAGSG
ncbi:MAG: NAD(P)H-dependent oxidoreductase, partial [Propionibacterium sp.]|nr:NAD(P)H-dependent oxidoreductase [Propionibacterium sp.]